MKTYFTSDLHFGCDGLIEQTRKRFSSTEQHDDTLIDAINSTVGCNDQLLILGDFCFKKPGRYRPRIRCRHIFFILGNHDKENKIRQVFGGHVWQGKMVKLGGQKIWCSHFPHAHWPDSHNGAYHAYGHLHNNLLFEERMDDWAPSRRSMDVGVDHAYAKFGQYRPFEDVEFFKAMRSRSGHDLVER